MMAEYAAPEQLAAAIRGLRSRGYRLLRAYTPFPAPEVEEALALPCSRLPLAVFAAGVAGAAVAYFLQWLTQAYLYPIDVGGRPSHFPSTFVPITFEMGVLAAAFAAIAGVLIRGRLVKLWDPVFEADGFESATEGGHWLSVLKPDPHYDREALARELAASGATRVIRLGGEG
jgi:hypothetical protein